MNLNEISVAYENLDLIASQVVEGFITGMHKSPFHGFSVEFAEHRLYNDGESTRNIDWKLYGRTDKLIVNRFDEETNLRCHILLDVSASMYYPQSSKLKIRFASVAAAVMAHLLKKQRDAFSLIRFSNEIHFQSDVKSSPTHYRQIIGELQKSIASDPPTGLSHIAETMDLIAEKIHRRSLVVILSDMFDASEEPDKLFSALQHLRFKKHEVILFHISDGQTENEFNFENRPYKFVDPETEEEIKVYPEDVKALYLQRIRKFREQLKLKCDQFRIDLIDADAGKDFNQILMPFFVKRRSMG